MTKLIMRTLGHLLRNSWRLLVVASLLLNLLLGTLAFILQPIWTAAQVATAVAATKADAEIAERKKIASFKSKAKTDEKAAVAKAIAKEKARARADKTLAVTKAVTKHKTEAKVAKLAAVSSALAEARTKSEKAKRIARVKAAREKDLAVARALAKHRANTEAAKLVAVGSALAAARIESEKDKKLAVAKEKAKSRVSRVATAVPFLGLVTAAGFEYSDFIAWKKENPDGSVSDYADEVVTVSKGIAEETLAALPSWASVDTDTFFGLYERIINKMTVWMD